MPEEVVVDDFAKSLSVDDFAGVYGTDAIGDGAVGFHGGAGDDHDKNNNHDHLRPHRTNGNGPRPVDVSVRDPMRGDSSTDCSISTTPTGNRNLTRVRFANVQTSSRNPSPGPRLSSTEEAPTKKPNASEKTTTSCYDGGPVDLDELFNRYNIAVDVDNVSFTEDGDEDGDGNDSVGKLEENFLASGSDDFYEDDDEEENRRFFFNPNRRLLDQDASLIPGSPFSKPANKKSNRPTEPLQMAKWASTLAVVVTAGWVGFLFFVAIWNYNSIGRIIIECLLALLSFFGLFWNSYFIVSSIFKCFIPAKALKTNTKYCSIIPETKPAGAPWLDVTIQIPVYKESLREVMMPTLKSCLRARDNYLQNTDNQGASCNIVVCDDGMMAFLRDNFPAAEMLWNSIQESQGRVLQLRKLLRLLPRASRRHLKGLRSKSVYEVFHRMLFYYHFRIGFVARSTVDRRGKFKKASNLNSHLRLALGAAQLAETEDDVTYEEALMMESHNEDGSRFVMFGNDIRLGHLICVNDADARMAESVILKTVPEFINDKTLGFTQHATKTMNEQRGENYFTNMLTVYTDTLYQGHFLLSSILGCHPPLVGHSIFLRTEAVKQCGRMRMMRKAQQWLKNIGLPFLPVDQIGFSNLRAENRIEYWSESHVSEDFELMIHLYNLGFNGRYCAYPDCEFQEGITRTFDEEAGRHRKFALGGHELVFNPFAEMLGHGVFTPLFKTFMTCDIPAYYKVFLTAYLCSYSTGGAYIIIFIAAAITRILDRDANHDLFTLAVFSPAGIIILNFVLYYVLGYVTMLISLIQMHFVNEKLLFPEYRKKWCGPHYLIFVSLRYCLPFQFLFYSVATFTFYALGSLDHLLSRPNICGATNKDSIQMSRCTALWETAKFNSGSWLISFVMACLAYATVLQEENWDPTAMPQELLGHALFAGPAMVLALMALFDPILLNPYILGWPFLRATKQPDKRNEPSKKGRLHSGNKKPTGHGKDTRPADAIIVRRRTTVSGRVLELPAFIDKAKELSTEIDRVQDRSDVELDSLATKELCSVAENNSQLLVDSSFSMPDPVPPVPPTPEQSGAVAGAAATSTGGTSI